MGESPLTVNWALIGGELGHSELAYSKAWQCGDCVLVEIATLYVLSYKNILKKLWPINLEVWEILLKRFFHKCVDMKSECD